MIEPNSPFSLRTIGCVTLSAAVCCVALAACSPAKNAGNGNNSSTPAAGGSDSAAASSAPASINACKLISADDITALLGTSVEGKSTSNNPEVPACSWENPENYESVSLEIGNSGTAPNNTLPPPEPGFPDVGTPLPDGMRSLGGGQVEFAAGNRNNSVQVAVLKLSSEEATNAAVDLAKKVGPKIPE
jgi:hypothetical protein